MKKDIYALSTLFEFGKPMLALVPTLYKHYPKKKKEDNGNEDNSKLKLKVSLFVVELINKSTSSDIDKGELNIVPGTISLNISKFPISASSAAVKEQIITYFNTNVESMSILDIELILKYIDYMNYLFKNKEKIGGLYRELEAVMYNENGIYVFDISSKKMYSVHMKKGVGKISTVFGKYMEAKRKRDSLQKRNLYKAFSGQMKNLAAECYDEDYSRIFKYSIINIVDDIIALSGNNDLTRYDIEFYCRYFNYPITLKGYNNDKK